MTVVKIGGADRELGAVVLGRPYSRGALTGYEAADRLLTEIDGWPRASSSPQRVVGARLGAFASATQGWGNPMDSRGRFLPNGACAYIDLGHPEICTPECRSASQYVACLQALLAIVQDALRRANARLADHEEIAVFVDNSDRQGNSYGSHLNVSLSRTLWDRMFRSRMFPYLGFLASFQASSIVLTGGGKVGSEDGAPDVDFQLSRRADFITSFVAERTTYDRPLINARDEALGAQARLHSIFFDSVLLPAANYLQFGCLQLVTALMEAEEMPHDVLLEAPLEALRCWSRDPGLSARARCLDGSWLTAVEHQARVLDHVNDFVAAGRADELVREAETVTAYWGETLGFLQRGDEDRAARRVEWLARRRLLESAMAADRSLNWQSLKIRALDLCFGELHPERGVYCSMAAQRAFDELVSAADIGHYKQHPPGDTRALARTALVRQLGEENVVSVDWDEVRVRHGQRVYGIQLPSPDQPVIALSDLTTELIEERARRLQPLHPYIND